MKPFQIILAAISFGVVASASIPNARAQSLSAYSYRVVIPANGVSCQSAAQSLAKKFLAATRAQDVVGSCQAEQNLSNLGENYKQYVVVVNYRASGQLIPYKTIFGGIDFEGGSTVSGGLFSSYRACLSARAQQLVYFERYSGLKAVDARCDSGNDLTNASWSLVIDGFGQSKAYLYGFKPFQFSSESFGAPVSDIVHSASLMIKKYGGHVVFDNNRIVFYYSSIGEQISDMTGPFFNKLSQCQVQLPEAHMIFNTFKRADVNVICHEDNSAQYQLVAIGKYANGVDEDIDADTIRYQTFGECMADRSRVEQNLRSNGVDFYGTICAPSDMVFSGYTMHVYTPFGGL